jgi:hypothetical protein
MISLARDCLVFRTAGGESIACTADALSFELIGETSSLLDPEFLKNAAAAVFHYFRDELGRDTVTVAEFSLALERVLRGFKLTVAEPLTAEPAPRIASADLSKLAADAEDGCELFFFPRLRDELRAQLRESPQMLCFQGIRECVLRLRGATRWSDRCQALHDQIVEYLRTCLSVEFPATPCALVVK